MVISKMLGGLGNQLFQYAAGLALADKLGSELKLDLTSFTTDDLRNFDLHNLNVDIIMASVAEVNRLKSHNTFQRLYQNMLPQTLKHFYKQPSFKYDPRFFSLRSPIYIQGYFQSEKFFQPVADQVRQAFTFKTEFRREILQIAEELKSKESVAVHIRRGDYQNAEALEVHGILPSNYYQSAVHYLQQTHHNKLSFFVFTDDPKGVRKGLDIPYTQILSGESTNNHFEDFYLMQCCRHNIIANSSFSWWAAWLNKNDKKTVIAPKKWFGQTKLDTSDLIPEGWLRL